MEKKRAGRPLLLILAVMIVVIAYSMWTSTSSDSQAGSVTSEQQLAQVLQEIHQVGQVTVYFHYGELVGEEQFMLSNYFRSAGGEAGITGVLIVAEGASNPAIKQLLKDSVSSVMQLPQHRIVIVPMQKKEDKS
ncbi:hypothetical protein [Solibacillus sp. FSL H8-0538]|uniref:hypothetical protein n=1 Tax=Solibacillus sp. FSL H8-0538 TaxID=2921400 RepID=UPI0030FC84F1